MNPKKKDEDLKTTFFQNETTFFQKILGVGVGPGWGWGDASPRKVDSSWKKARMNPKKKDEDFKTTFFQNETTFFQKILVYIVYI